MTGRARYAGSLHRVRWAMRHAGWPIEKQGIWMFSLTVGDARRIAEAAGVPFAFLYLPDPGLRQTLAAWLHGRSRWAP